jgi:hypothetical protein
LIYSPTPNQKQKLPSEIAARWNNELIPQAKAISRDHWGHVWTLDIESNQKLKHSQYKAEIWKAES